MLCFKFRDTGTCDVKDCKYLHATKEEFAKLTAFVSQSSNKVSNNKNKAGEEAKGEKKKRKPKAKKGGGEGAAAEQPVA